MSSTESGLNTPGNSLLPKPSFPPLKGASYQFSYLNFPSSSCPEEPGKQLCYFTHCSHGPQKLQGLSVPGQHHFPSWLWWILWLWQGGICAQILSFWGNKDGDRILGGGNDIYLLHITVSLKKPRILIFGLVSIGIISGLASEAMGAWVQHAGHLTLEASVSSSVKCLSVTNINLNACWGMLCMKPFCTQPGALVVP